MINKARMINKVKEIIIGDPNPIGYPLTIDYIPGNDGLCISLENERQAFNVDEVKILISRLQDFVNDSIDISKDDNE